MPTLSTTETNTNYVITPQAFSSRLLAWYIEQRRSLPWRTTNSPYKVWLSEIILQQTRVTQGLPYYQRFISSFPTIQALAKASTQEILRLWQGLGYYTRARNLHKCAQYITYTLDGTFPTTYKELLKLPGVGPYTAAAIASIAFHQPIAVLDGNVYRVLARIFGLKDDISSPKTTQKFRRIAQSLIDPTQPGDYNQAIMEFGALQCTPKQPSCHNCIFQQDCFAYASGLPTELPINNKKLKIRDRYFYYFVISYQEKLFLKERAQKDIWQGLYDFYLVESKVEKKPDQLHDPLLEALSQANIQLQSMGKPYQHQLTHQRIHASFFYITANATIAQIATAAGLHLFTGQEIPALPKPILIAKYCRAWLADFPRFIKTTYSKKNQ